MMTKHSESAETAPETEPTLFRRFPELRAHLPWVGLTRGPTRVHRLMRLGHRLGMAELWIKRDDECGLWYGGNKPRKLEFLLGDALARGAETLITFGGLGSNHALATTIYGRKLGLHPVLILVPEPLSEEVVYNLLLCHSQGAELIYSGGTLHAVWSAMRRWLTTVARLKRPPYVILPGGSSPRGCLGYVSAALELADQIEAGELPRPEAIFVPVGSNGTMAGLVVGLRLAGLETQVIGVRVSDQLPISARTVAILGSRCWALLRRYAPDLPPGRAAPPQVTVWHDYLGQGYAYPTPEGEQAVRLMADQEGIQLDEVYTGKTLAGLIDAAGDPEFRKRRVLFWNTFNSLPLSGLLPECYDYRLLPVAFHHFFDQRDVRP